MLYLWAKIFFVQAINKITSPGDVEDEVLHRVLQKERTKVKERGRRSAWDEKAMKDLVDIIVNNQVSQKILLFTNVKNVTNSR